MSEAHRLILQDDMTIYHAAEQFQLINSALADHEAVELDLSRVGDMDATGLQLLILFKRESERLGRPGRIVGHGQSVREVIDLTNMAAWLGDPIIIDSQASGR